MAMLTGLRVDTAGVVTTTAIDSAHTLNELYRVLQCDTIQILELDQGIDLIIDEESKIRRLDSNPTATAVASVLGYRFLPGDGITGPAVFFRTDAEGDTQSLTDTQRQLLLRAVVVAQA